MISSCRVGHQRKVLPTIDDDRRPACARARGGGASPSERGGSGASRGYHRLWYLGRLRCLLPLARPPGRARRRVRTRGRDGRADALAHVGRPRRPADRRGGDDDQLAQRVPRSLDRPVQPHQGPAAARRPRDHRWQVDSFSSGHLVRPVRPARALAVRRVAAEAAHGAEGDGGQPHRRVRAAGQGRLLGLALGDVPTAGAVGLDADRRAYLLYPPGYRGQVRARVRGRRVAG